MSTLDKLVVKISADTTELKKGIETVNKKLLQTTKNQETTNKRLVSVNQKLIQTTKNQQTANNRLGLSFGGLVARVGGLAIAYRGLTAIMNRLKSSVVMAGEFEQTQISMEVMLDSVSRGNKLISEAVKLAQRSPFNFREIVSSARKIKALGIETENVISTLEMLGNIASGVGREKLPRLVLALAQVKAKGRLMAEELNRQFAEAGVPLRQAIMDNMQITGNEFERLMSRGKIRFEEVQTALMGMTQGSGKFANLMQRQSLTYLGTLERVKEKFDIIQIKLGTKMLPALQKLLNLLSKISDKLGGDNLDFDKKSKLESNIENEKIRLKILNNLLDDLKNGTNKVSITASKATKIFSALGSSIRDSFIALSGGTPNSRDKEETDPLTNKIEKITTAINKSKLALQTYQEELAKYVEMENNVTTQVGQSWAQLRGISNETALSIRDMWIETTTAWSEHLTRAIINGENMLESFAKLAQQTLIQTLVVDPFISSLQSSATRLLTPIKTPTAQPAGAMSMSIINNFNPNVTSTVRAEIANAAPLIQQSAIAGMQQKQYNGQA